MRIFPKPLDIGEREGFEHKDLFERKTVANSLLALLERISEPLTIAIDGEWGTGKTTFLKMLLGELKAKHSVVFIDSFQVDFASDPFTAIAAALSVLDTPKKRVFVTLPSGLDCF